MKEKLPEFTKIPQEELDLFKQLKDLKVIFDVGARTDTDYIDIWPDSEYHLFEPKPEFCEVLKEKVGDNPNVHINQMGLGDREEVRNYHDQLQSFYGSWILGDGNAADYKFPINTLGWYVEKHNIKNIDFIKMDTEGFELKILLGATGQFPIIKYLQYEHFGLTNHKVIKGLLEDDFYIEHIGYRNVLAMNKKLVPEEEYLRLKKYIEGNKLDDLK